jgi:hypothetical protein
MILRHKMRETDELVVQLRMGISCLVCVRRCQNGLAVRAKQPLNLGQPIKSDFSRLYSVLTVNNSQQSAIQDFFSFVEEKTTEETFFFFSNKKP